MNLNDSSPKKSAGGAAKPVERLFPFAVRSRIVVAGRDSLSRQRKKLRFILIARELTENSRKEILRTFEGTPVIERYSSSELEQSFHVRGAKVLGFKKSSLAQSIFNELKSLQ